MNMKLTEIKLSKKQKLVLKVLEDEFHGSAFGPQMLEESENEDLKQLTIREVTWAFKVLFESALVEKEKQKYQGRILNLYKLSNYFLYDAVIIK